MKEENPCVNCQRLIARLAAYHVFQNKGESDKAKDYLADAESDVNLLKSHPRFLYGNLTRMIYFDLKSDLDGVEAAMQDAIASNNRGIIVTPYVTALYRREKYAEAFERLTSMPGDDDPFWITSCVFLFADSPEGRKKAEELCRNSISQDESAGRIIDCLFLLGLEREASERASENYKKAELSTYWPLGREMMRYRAARVGEDDLVELENKLVELAGDSERDKAEVHWLIGLRKLAQGDREGAKKSFNKIASSPVFVWSTVMWARAFAERMDREPNWPDWLPSQPVEGGPK
jgi:hypothetical protein